MTRLDVGHETKAASRSTTVTSIRPPLHFRMYLAAVAPPYPAPTTTTLGAAACASFEWVPTATAANDADAALRNSRRVVRARPFAPRSRAFIALPALRSTQQPPRS